MNASSAQMPLPERSRWQRELAQAITDPRELLAVLALPAPWLEPAERAARAFPLRVPRSFVARMRRGDVHDPLLRQVLPLDAELVEMPGYSPDPLEERAARRAPQLLQKYAGRALLVTTEACAVHCRYCFRREYPYTEGAQNAGGRWSEALAAIAADPGLEEIILSGGDPLSLSDSRLAQLTDALAGIPHVKRLRVHTRQPIVLPARVDAGLLEWLRGIRLPTIVVLHTNHPDEIDADVRQACASLRRAGATLLNQSVLLRGVNDDAGTLERLSVALIDAGVLPYYLHLPDRVRGTAHFDVDEGTAMLLVTELTRRLSGYLVPKLVREIPGAESKVALSARPVA
ncbi:MAG TPA: EF-P beta-lysylation protein EpmB [Steroidobacteraceae bacterium]|nr:EF-P beta-lysylation protein EpmB [Steroidobacteraceae bacterium]